MITTFDVARWGVRTSIIASILLSVLGMLQNVAGGVFLPTMFPTGFSPLSALPNLVVYTLLFFFSDPFAREIAGSHETTGETFESPQQLRPMAVAFVGFLILKTAFASGLFASAVLLYQFVRSSLDPGSIAPVSFTGASAQILILTVGTALLQLLIGIILLLWRRIARLFARSAV